MATGRLSAQRGAAGGYPAHRGAALSACRARLGQERVLLWRTVNLFVCQELRLIASTSPRSPRRRPGNCTRACAACSALATNCTGSPTNRAHVRGHGALPVPAADRGSPVLRAALRHAAHRCCSMNSASTSTCTMPAVGCSSPQAGLDGFDSKTVNAFFGATSSSRHAAVTSAIGLFNRLSEECLRPGGPAPRRGQRPTSRPCSRMYAAYLDNWRQASARAHRLLLLQQEAAAGARPFDGPGRCSGT